MSYKEFQEAIERNIKFYNDLSKETQIKYAYHPKPWQEQIQDIPDADKLKKLKELKELATKQYLPQIMKRKVAEAVEKEDINTLEKCSETIKNELENCIRPTLVEADEKCDDAIAVIYMKQALE